MSNNKKSLIGSESLVLNWDKCAAFILMFWCIQPVITAAAQIYHPVAGAVTGSSLFFLSGIAACIICVLYLTKKITHEGTGFFTGLWKTRRPYIFLAAMLLWGGAAAFFADFRYTAFFGSAYRLDGYLSYCIYAGFFGCAAIIGSREKLLRIIRCFVLVSVVLGIMSLIAMIPFFSQTPNIYCISLRYMRGTSMFYNINHYGYYLVMVILCAAGLFVNEKNRARSAGWLAVMLFNVWVLVDNNTFGCFLAALLALAAAGFIYKAAGSGKLRAFIPVIAFVLLSACLTPFYGIMRNFDVLKNDISKFSNEEDESTAGSGRWTLWVQTAELIARRPVFGYGPECLLGRFTRKITDESGAEKIIVSFQDRPHNEYLQHAAFMGVPALIFYLAALISLLADRIKRVRKLPVPVIIAGCAVIAYAVSAFFGNTMYYTAPFYFILLGMAANDAAEDVK